MTTAAELATLYNVTDRTVRNWQKKQAPLDDPPAMAEWISGQRTRRGVGKRFRRTVVVEPEPASDVVFASQADLADFVTAMSSDIDRICGLIAAARAPLASASPDVYRAFEPLIELCESWAKAG